MEIWEGINRDQHSQAAVCDIPEVTFPTVKWTQGDVYTVTLPCQLPHTLPRRFYCSLSRNKAQGSHKPLTSTANACSGAHLESQLMLTCEGHEFKASPEDAVRCKTRKKERRAVWGEKKGMRKEREEKKGIRRKWGTVGGRRRKGRKERERRVGIV